MSTEDDVMKQALGLENLPLKIDNLTAIRVVALMLAMKHHDTTIIRDAEMYRQLKADGVNIRQTGFEDILETALKIEKHLIVEPKWLVEAAAKVEAESGVNPFGDEPQAEELRRVAAALSDKGLS